MSAQWPVARREAKPGTRWWWMGSAVDSVNLTRNLETYANAGIGSVEITPIYGVNGNERNEIEFLSDRWMNMLSHTISEGKRLGIDVDMNTGTGWPFGGPSVNIDDAASKLEYTATAIGYSVRYDISCGHTRQAVKRAAPGGEGLVLDHLNKDAVARYLNRFKEAFSRTCSPLPHSFFNDSYEVYGADWTPSMLDEFEKRRGYRLQDHLTEFLQDSATNHRYVIQDYRETMSDLLLSNFTNQWAEWAHSMGSTVRNQGHGSPANLLDVYAAVDIPEIEGFGLTDFGISGLRTDSMWKKNDADLTMLKYASSAAHICGKPYTSSETFTWLTEHFRTSLSQCKPDFDLMQIGGVNHCYFHGTTYSPAIDESNPWPGHLFYASMEMSPVNTIWKDAPAFFSYITRVQSFMQYGKPDNDLLMYMPVYDAWYENDGRLLMFAIHGMEKKSPRFVDAVNEIYNAGYDMDYVSDRMIEDTRIGDDGTLVSSGGAHYKALVLPGVHFMQPETMTHILSLAKMGATIIIVGQRPDNVPGLYNRETRLNDLRGLVEGLDSCPNVIFAETYAVALDSITDIKAECMKSQYGLKCIRRSNANGHHYFISSLQSKGVDADVELAVAAKSAVLFDPMTGRRGIARIKNDGSAASVRLQLASGESFILQTFAHLTDNDLRVLDPSLTIWNYTEEIDGHKITLDNIKWTMDATSLEGAENKDLRKYQTLGTQAWTETPALANTKGSVTYSTTLKITRKQLQSIGASDWVLDLGDVRESAHVWINGHDVGTVFAVPFRLNIGQYLKAGKNQIRIEVTGLAANYIAQMDRNGKVWRRFKNANIAVLPGYDKNPAYKDYKNWGTIPCGLNSSVSLIPVRNN
ncbi:MAG: glycosyl hydrolase family 2 [Bacteroidales bacterium]|nr:glycosyl hydrolase family 2 [Candidatus Liminaster caballi]